jgi:carbamoyl-phosphate synthase small subunit
MSSAAEYNWKAKREKKAFIALENGKIFYGRSVGAPADIEGEVVFNTGMTGYQEIITDPSYAGQFVTMTYTEIGNTGINAADMESGRPWVNGFIMHNMNEPSNWRSEISLSDYLKKHNIPGLDGLDTRALTLLLRTSGTMKAYMRCSESGPSPEEAVKIAKSWSGLDGQDYASKVTCDKTWKWDPDGKLTRSWGVAEKLHKPDIKIVAYDFGIKWNILRSLRVCGMDVTVVPARTSAADVLALKPDGVFLSNGPADPAALDYAIEAAKNLIGKIPVMGICLGHQILCIACGGKSYRLKFGHHGCNHPVKNLATGAVEITSQNHNFSIDPKTIPSCLETTHINLNDHTVEGVRHKTAPMFAVQYHPEASPGPHDPRYLFNQFRELIKTA